MNRSELQRLSNARLREAKILSRANEFSGAYYLAGYAVECALKACFAKSVKRHDFPDKKAKVFTHNLAELVDLAGLKAEFIAARQLRPVLQANWDIVNKWNEESRYSSWSKDSADDLLNAIGRRKYGVLP
jgi:hypothetical protein